MGSMGSPARSGSGLGFSCASKASSSLSTLAGGVTMDFQRVASSSNVYISAKLYSSFTKHIYSVSFIIFTITNNHTFLT